MDEDDLIQKMRASMAKQGQVMSPEQELKMRMQIREMQQRMQGLQNGGLRVPMPVVTGGVPPAMSPMATSPVAASRTTADLAQAMAQLPPAQAVEVEPRRDGFVVNGRPMVDPEGKVQRAMVDPQTGDFAYLVPRMDGSQVLKRGRGTAPPIAVAQLHGQTGRWTLQTVDGQTLAGDGVLLSSRGALLLRESSAFEFQPGEAVRTIAIPAGWTPVPLQRGDVASTRVMLLEKDASARPAEGSFSQLLQSVKRLTGSESPDDYALFHIDRGTLTPLALSLDDKQVTRFSQCRRQNAAVNRCGSAESYESLWKPDGSKNSWHYYWQVQWFNLPGGPMAVARQSTAKEVRLFDLNSGKQVVAFRRPMGIASHDAVLTEAGKLRVTAQLAFTTHTLEDARALLDRLPDQRNVDLEGTIVSGYPEGSAPPASAASTGP